MKRTPKTPADTFIDTTRLPQRCPACGSLALTIQERIASTLVTCARPCGWSAAYRIVSEVTR